LAQVLRPLQETFRASDFPDLLVGLEGPDDAAVYRVSDELALVLTLDFFTPIVDDPYQFGAIAAANAMSDVYAMGGDVVMALNIAAFPPKMPAPIIAEILRGGAEKVAEAGGVIAGGHTIDDDEPKYGLAVLGFVHPQRVATKGGAQPGDRLALTKPLGVGIITTAAKADLTDPEHVRAATESMLTLNRRGARLMRAAGFHGATDITGFALLGHACEMAEQGGVRLRFHLDQMPFLPGALTYAEQWLFPGGACRNQDTYKAMVQLAPGVEEDREMLLYTPETSGGLLIALSPESLEKLKTLCRDEGQPLWEIGEVLEGEGIEVRK
jgi:selenide,water dikinase